MQRTTRTTINQPNRSTPAQANRTTVSKAGGAGIPTSASGNGSTVACRKCKSTQIVANKRGYSFSKMFKTLGWMALLPLLVVIIGAYYFWMIMDIGSGGTGISEGLITFIGIICWISISLSLPVSILVGFVGRSEIVNGCMNCGFKWSPAKKK